MIRYALRCEQDHAFESWFQSAEGYDALRKAGHVLCPECGSSEVEKSLMAPQVRPGRKSASPDLRSAETDKEQALAKLREEVEKNSDYVGMNFAKEARRIHEGEAPERSIYGQARIDEAKKLIEDGIPVAPLPFTPRSQTN